jgi:hypothetical protein
VAAWREFLKALAAAREALEEHGDRANADHARHLEVRRLLLVGDLDEAGRRLAEIDAQELRPPSRAVHELAAAGIAVRRLRTEEAQAALARAWSAAHDAGIPALMAEVERASLALARPAARRIVRGEERLVQLAEVEALLASGELVVDACRRVVRAGDRVVSLATRPVLFGLARALGEAWPGDVTRGGLLSRAFGARFVDESHRARLRVEIGRLRSALGPLAGITATERGYVLVPGGPGGGREVSVLAPPVEGQHGEVLALLSDGELWSSSALALALGVSQRTVQRSLEALASEGEVQAFGRGRARRWTTPPVPGFTTTLLLPAPLPE